MQRGEHDEKPGAAAVVTVAASSLRLVLSRLMTRAADAMVVMMVLLR